MPTKPTMHTLSAGLRFPKPRWRIDGSVLDSPPPTGALVGYLEEVRSWRAAVLEFIVKSAGKPASEAGGLSERARKAFDTFLASNWTEQTTQWAVQSPYNLGPFPAGALEAGIESPLNLMLEVLRWRAGVSDCLSDIWDVIGDPYLDLDECMAIGQFLQPGAPKKICGYCLTESHLKAYISIATNVCSSVMSVPSGLQCHLPLQDGHRKSQ